MSIFSTMTPLTYSDLYVWLFIPAMIFCARILDVSIGTVRIILLARGNTLSVLLGFIESLVWIVVISQVMQNLENPASYVGWAAGFAAGTYVGILLEGRLAIGTLLVRVITPNGSLALTHQLANAGYGVTSVDAHGAKGEVQLIYTIIQRKHLQAVLDTIKSVEPKAFVSVEAIQSASLGVFPKPLAPRLIPFGISRQRQRQKRK
jgi:uncharacterized protein YebE (UPF0316 family)